MDWLAQAMEAPVLQHLGKPIKVSAASRSEQIFAQNVESVIRKDFHNAVRSDKLELKFSRLSTAPMGADHQNPIQTRYKA